MPAISSRKRTFCSIGVIIFLILVSAASCVLFLLHSSAVYTQTSTLPTHGEASNSKVIQGGYQYFRNNKTAAPAAHVRGMNETISNIFYVNRTIIYDRAISKPVHYHSRLKDEASALSLSLPESAILLSENAEVTASVRGNLGPPEVILSPKIANWLNDRWQAARNMNGDPIPGPHFIRMRLKTIARQVSRVVLDFESAYATDYKIDALCGVTGIWTELHNNIKGKWGQNKVAVNSSVHQHVVHTIDMPAGYALLDTSASFIFSNICNIVEVRVTIRKPATRWGTSLWRVEVWGYLK